MEEMQFNEPRQMPVLAIRGISVFPGTMLTFDVERPASKAALHAAMGKDQILFLTAQKDASVDEPTAEDLYEVGTICRVKQALRTPGTKIVRVLVDGLTRGYMRGLHQENNCNYAEVTELPDAPETEPILTEALLRRCTGLFTEYAETTGTVSQEAFLFVMTNQEPALVADVIAQSIYLKPEEKQQLLEETMPSRRLGLLKDLLDREIQVAMVEKDIDNATQERVNKSQREFYLREQLQAIRTELGEGEFGDDDELNEYKQKILNLHLEQEVEQKLLKELSRLAKQPMGSSEASVLRNYLDVCLELPWNQLSEERLDVTEARKILDEDHYGLDKVKERIIEFLSVRQLAPDLKGGVLCLVGPPGTGKTSIAMSVARAMNRKLCRVSLGGLHDEAEIRGHRKTYIGAMPGRIITGMQQAGSMNPVMVLDEIDKVGADYKGDPSAALLEVFDYEQNNKFRDNFLEIPFDLSQVLFITTANTLDTVPRPLRDRMEIIELGSYTDEEKLHIAKDHLLPKQRKKHGLKASQLKISDDALRDVIARYTRESGVRILERELAAICRKTAAKIAEGTCKSVTIRSNHLENYLSIPRYGKDLIYPKDEVGLVRGLAWTSVGGEVLDVEVSVVEGTGKMELTGNLGDVMKESAKAALTYIRSRADVLGLESDFYKTKDIHIHFPEGAVPKDGPSAGITICIALISALTDIPVHRDVAMTGEITLRGRILPIGGLKEKTMAAMRTGVHTVIIPAENEKDLEEIDPDVRRALNFVTTDHVDKILDVALTRMPGKLTAKKPETKRKTKAKNAEVRQ